MQLLREELEELDAAGRDTLAVLLPSVIQVPLDADSESHGHIVLLQVAADFPKLLVLLLTQIPDLRQRSSYAAHDVRENYKGKHHHHHSEDALGKVLGLHVHGGGRELGDGPVERSGVLVEPLGVHEAVVGDPSLVLAKLDISEEKPEASDDVVNHQQQQDHLGYVASDADILAVDDVVKLLGHRLQLQHSHKPHDADGAEQPQEVCGVALLPNLGEEAQHGQDPVGHHDHQVHQQPRSRILHQDFPETHDCDAVLDIADEQRRRHVQGEKDQDDPVDSPNEGGFRRMEGPQGDHKQVEEHKHRTQHVPHKPARTPREADEVP
mmetsp:Transcript_32323/g.74996  ORF Transcript_32323/g.74996 Transcript_32323/m.74996 type:complete len:323 (-) Transcript_32323:802-1770(-)